MHSLNALLRRRPLTVDPLELRRLVASVRRRVLARREATSVGRYALVDKLGEGGFGIVYRAYDPRTRRHVALKVLRPDVRGQTSRPLREEARTLAAVDSERVVRVLDFGRAEGREFFVMQLLEGTSLRRWTPQSAAQALSVLRDIVAGVEALHAQRLLHCDLKPDNVLIDASGRAVLVDLGLAFRVDAPRALVRSLGGTPPYCAPEQLRGGPVDLRADQYALGTMGLELLERAPESPTGERACEVFRQATQHVPDHRYESVTALRRSLAPQRRSGRRIAVAFVVATGLLALAWVRGPKVSIPDDEVVKAPIRAPRDTLRIQLDAAHVLLEAERHDEARAAVESISAEVWQSGDPSGQADGLALRADLAFESGQDERGLELLEAAVWTALDGDRDRTVALHATELSAHIARCTGDAAASERMGNLAWAAIVRDGSAPNLVARYWSTRAFVERFLGRPDRELEAAKAALSAIAQTPEGASWREHTDVGIAYQSNGDPARARDALRHAFAIAGDDPKADGMIGPALAEAEYEVGDAEAAIRIARAVLTRSIERRGPTHPITVNARASLGMMLIEHDATEAALHLRTNVETYGESHSILAEIARANLARALAGAGEADEGERLLARSIASLESEGTAATYDLGFLYGMLGDVQTMAGRREVAHQSYAQAIDRLEGEAYAAELVEDLRSRQRDLGVSSESEQAQDVADDR